MLTAFLRAVYFGVSGGAMEITYIHPEKPPAGNGRTLITWYTFGHTDWAKLERGAFHMNALGYSVYFGVGVRAQAKDAHHRGKKADVTALTVLWADLDGVEEQAGIARLNGLELPPTMIVHSGGGLHGYWFLREPFVLAHESDRERSERTLRGLALATGGDTKVAELARIMRLPGTKNTKPGRDGRECRIVQSTPTRYAYATLEVQFASLVPPPSVVTRDVSKLRTPSGARAKWVQEYLDTGAAQGNRNNRLYAVARWYNDNGISQEQAESELTGRAMTDGLPDWEARRTIESAYRAEQGVPNAPEHVKERISGRDRIQATLQGKGKLNGKSR